MAYGNFDSEQTRAERPGKTDFLFSSSFRSIQASGVFAQVDTAAVDGGQSDGVFQHRVREAFEKAKGAGLENPIMLGAIPFDVTQPSQLYIPAEYQQVERNALMEAVGRRSLQSTVVGTNSVPGKNRFKQSVKQAIANFQHSDIRKAVLSRILDVEMASTVDIKQIFAQLVRQNPSGYHFRVPMDNPESV